MFSKKITALAVLAPLAFVALNAQASDTVASKSASATSSTNILRPIAVASSGTLTFGTIVKPSASTTNVAVSTAGARTLSGGDGLVVGTSAAASVPTFTVTGEGAQAITITIPATFDLSNGSSTLTVTTSNDLSGAASSQVLGGSLGGEGTKTVKVGGNFDLTSSTATGAYTGTLTVSASYN